MSFKRDGDDFNLLNNLKRRRVSELLALHIPEDEALLLKNGRYTCLVCKHRPIFDTLDILAIHRKGKKHLESLSRFLAKQQELKDIIFKRRQEQYLKTGNLNITLPNCGPSVCCSKSLKNSPLLKKGPYNSCRRKAKVTDRKLAIDLGRQVLAKVDIIDAEESPLLPPQKTPIAMVQTYLKSMQCKGSFETLVEKSRRLGNLPFRHVSSDHLICKSMQCSSSDNCNLTKDSTFTVEQRKKADFFLNLRRDGWKRTSEGEWVKDEQAEFDSDEETPPLFHE